MNNAWLIIPRLPLVGLRSPLRPSTCRILPPFTSRSRQFEARRVFSLTTSKLLPRELPKKAPAKPVKPRPVGKSTRSSAHNDLEVPIPRSVVHTIFGKDMDWQTGKDIMHKIHKRRVEGSIIDLGLRRLKVEGVTKEQKVAALEWLRQKYPVNEVAAAEQYAMEEEQNYRNTFEKRALNSWLYQKPKNGPDEDLAELPEQDQVEKGVDRWRDMKNARYKEQTKEIKKLEEEYKVKQEELALEVAQNKIQEAEKRDEKLKTWDELEKKAMLEPEKILDEKRTAFSRLANPVAFTTIVLLISIFILDSADVETPQKADVAKDGKQALSERFDKPSMMTCGAIMAINLLFWLAWRHPRAGWYMNRYFMLSAGDPKTFSLLGAVFSHQFWIFHLASNSAMLFALGVPLHDEIGRQNFLAAYIASGVIGGCTSIAYHVLRRNFIMVSLGASGAVAGLAGLYMAIEPQRRVDIPFQNETVTVESWWMIAAFVGLESLMWAITKGKVLDHVNHLSGLLTGVLFGRLLRTNQPAAASTIPEEAIKNTKKAVDATGKL